MKRTDLHQYQNKAVEFIKDKKRCALFIDMGLGKSVSALTPVKDLTEDFAVTRTLVIAPFRVANSVWKQEADKWDHTKDLVVKVCTGSTNERTAALNSDSDIYVINRENVKWLVENFKWKWDCVIIDESSSFKSYSSQRFKALKSVLHLTKYMILLTGTPASNGYMDLWSQIYLVDKGEALGKNITAYRSRFFTKFGFKYTLNKGADEVIKERISSFTLSMKAEDYLELPDCLYLYENIKMDKKLSARYTSFVEELVLENGEEEITAINAAVLTNKLMQFTNGAVYDEDKKAHHIHDLKIEALKELVEENSGENLLVAYNFKSDLERLIEAFPDAVVLDKDNRTVERWNQGEISMLLAHPACLHGDTEVLTEFRGWVKITEVKITERVHDGIEFVNHDGCQYSGIKPIINRFGINLTENHKLLINNEWKEAKDVSNNRRTRNKAHYANSGNGCGESGMPDLQINKYITKTKCNKVKQTWTRLLQCLYNNNLPQYDKYPHMESMDVNDRQMPQQTTERCSLSESWGVQGLARVQKFLQRYGNWFSRTFNFGQNRQREWLFKEQLQVGNNVRAATKQEKQQNSYLQRCTLYFRAFLRSSWNKSRCYYSEVKQRFNDRTSYFGLSKFKISKKQKVAKVYDLVNCGKRNSFLIRNHKGEVFVSHNSAGHGLNLQKGGSIIVWFGLNHSLELYEQFNARLYRQGQTKPVRIVHLIIEGTVDQKVMSALDKKADVQNELMSYFKLFLK